MNRRHCVASSTAAAAGIVLGRLPLGAQAPAAQAPPVTTFTELRRGVGYFTGQGGTIGYLVNADGAVAVDSQFMNTAELCVAGLKQRAPKGIAMLLNTHHHGDHTGGNMAFKPLVRRIVAHANCAKWQRTVAEQANTLAQQAIADVTYTDSWTESFGNERIEMRYYGAGHTSGDSVVTFQQANVIHLGDLMFNHAHPNIDRAAGARIDNWIVLLERVAKTASADTIFIAGHAMNQTPRMERAGVLAFRDYLTALLEAGRRAVATGQSKDELQKLPALKGFEDYVGPNPRINLPFVLGLAFDEASEKK
jgi:glyoxylase-like metal-dependent hydrolase (beta-lactamase superfamily II)